MPKYFKEGRIYDKYFRLIKLTQREHHVEVVLQVRDKDYLERPKIAEACATMIAKAFGKVRLDGKSEIREHKTNKKVITFDENNFVHEEFETLYWQVFYFSRWVRPKRRKHVSGKR